MTIGFLFWLLMIIWLVFGVYRGYTAGTSPWPLGGDLLLFLLLFLLGWQLFGFPIKG